MSFITLIFIVLGIIVGISKSAGILTLISILGFMWVGNCISGILTGQIQTLAGRSADIRRIVHRNEEPSYYYFELLFEACLGGMALVYFFRHF
ncbi:hypothetical protein [Pelagibaculum spongiae]|uniref:hypothetical protein n=1 Tax=Pelagibaculum spongiae TaxID=2080658 RepID=UPI001057BA29|nr:hypothetical protein [Pelagibaculum spongiae]